MKYITTIDNREYTVEILNDGLVTVNGKTYRVDFESINGQPLYSLLVDGVSYEGMAYPTEEAWEVLLRGYLYKATVEDERERRLRAASGGGKVQNAHFHLKAPMPGLVVAVPVSEGQTVKTGDVLVILESMKMQNELKSPQDGVVRRVRIAAGQSVERNQVMLSVHTEA
ncbi:MAG: acetyl-CoA carboxylase biotin carboxyl carrier protein subunit [Anaerolineales bacterium]